MLSINLVLLKVHQKIGLFCFFIQKKRYMLITDNHNLLIWKKTDKKIMKNIHLPTICE